MIKISETKFYCIFSEWQTLCNSCICQQLNGNECVQLKNDFGHQSKSGIILISKNLSLILKPLK
jgi:hypothetical protein